jgi:hypothetical protein
LIRIKRTKSFGSLSVFYDERNFLRTKTKPKQKQQPSNEVKIRTAECGGSGWGEDVEIAPFESLTEEAVSYPKYLGSVVLRCACCACACAVHAFMLALVLVL